MNDSINNIDGIEEMPDEEINREIDFWEKYDEMLEAFRFYKGVDEVKVSTTLQKYLSTLPKPEAIETKIPSLNKITGGFCEGELVIISGPTGQGKTSLVCSLISDFAEKDTGSLLLSYEVGVRDILSKFGVVTPLFYLPQQVVPSNLIWLEQRIWEAKAKYDVKAVFVDHLHFLMGMADLAKAKSTSILVGQIMRDLKLMALRTKTTMFLVSHVTKVDTRQEPSINDLRDSSFVGQEADIVLIVWREKRREGYGDISFLKVDKNRRLGTLSKVALILQGGRFRETMCEPY